MVGAICKWEVLFHPIVTIQCFGWTVFFRAVFAGPNQTFLSLLTKAGVFEHPMKLLRSLPSTLGRDFQRPSGKPELSLVQVKARRLGETRFDLTHPGDIICPYTPISEAFVVFLLAMAGRQLTGWGPGVKSKLAEQTKHSWIRRADTPGSTASSIGKMGGCNRG
jgi:hypothetical protein